MRFTYEISGPAVFGLSAGRGLPWEVRIYLDGIRRGTLHFATRAAAERWILDQVKPGSDPMGTLPERVACRLESLITSVVYLAAALAAVFALLGVAIFLKMGPSLDTLEPPELRTEALLCMACYLKRLAPLEEELSQRMIAREAGEEDGRGR